MPIRVASFFLPNTNTLPFLFDDTYMRGSYRVMTDKAERDGMHPAKKKNGMLVHTQDDGMTWQLLADGTWKEASLNGGKAVNPLSPVYFDVNGDLGVAPEALLPNGGETGNVLTRHPDGSAVWTPQSASSAQGTRSSFTHGVPTAVSPGGFHDFDVTMGKTVELLRVELDAAQLEVEAFSTPFRDDTNPYKFISRPEQLFDNGSSVTAGGEITYNQRYNTLSNFEDIPATSIYWRITNISNLPITPELSVTYLVLE